jgi:hypothetical protein
MVDDVFKKFIRAITCTVFLSAKTMYANVEKTVFSKMDMICVTSPQHKPEGLYKW